MTIKIKPMFGLQKYLTSKAVKKANKLQHRQAKRQAKLALTQKIKPEQTEQPEVQEVIGELVETITQ